MLRKALGTALPRDILQRDIDLLRSECRLSVPEIFPCAPLRSRALPQRWASSHSAFPTAGEGMGSGPTLMAMVLLRHVHHWR